MNYGETIKKSMERLEKDEKTIFIGYNISFGSQAYGTLKDIPSIQKIETPLAENLMVGLAIGLGMGGYRPVLFFERHDFILNALDGLVNHLDKMAGGFKKFDEEQIMLSGQMSDRTDRIEKLETFAFSN